MTRLCNGSPCIDCGGTGGECPAEATLDELIGMRAGTLPPRAVRITAVQLAALAGQNPLDEVAALFGGELIGDRLERLLKAIGLPPCAGCASRRDWLNKAHAWLREQLA